MKSLRLFCLCSIASFASYSLFSDITEEQKALLESLPPDQRSSVMAKMETANSIEGDLEEIFENEQSLVERPDYKALSELERVRTEECSNCIFGYEFFKYAPTTFAPVNNLPISTDYLLGPGDKLKVSLLCFEFKNHS